MIFARVVAVITALGLGWQTAISFVFGALLSAIAGNIGMNIAVRSNTRTAAAAQKSLNDGLRVAFGSGTVMGMSVVSLGLGGIALLSLLFAATGATLAQITQWVTGFGFGASSIALFARVGSGIYTKAADVGADLVGKVEKNMPEDDPRNPAVIADNVGDNVGDVAGMGADLFESYVGSIIAASALSIANDNHAAELPFLVAAIGIFASIIGTFLVRTKEGAKQEDLLRTLRTAISGACGVGILGFAGLALTGCMSWAIFGVIVTGLIAGDVIGYFTEY